MTIQGKTAQPLANRRGSSGLIFTVLFLAAMVLFYVGERLVLESTTLRLALAGLGALGVLVALIGRYVRRSKVPARARMVENRLLICYLFGIVALLLYLAQADFIMDRIRPLLSGAQTADRYQTVLMVLWPVIWICSVVPMIFIEISYAPMDVVKTLEPNRIRYSAASALVMALTLCLIFVLNFISSEFNKKVDLSYFKTTRASESSLKMIKNLSEPMEVLLFFPGANEVQDQVEAYFASLQQASKRLTTRVVDHVLEPGMAKKLDVTDNGVVVLKRGKQHQQIRVGTKLKSAKRKLRKLDGEFQKAFHKLSREKKVAYLTVGHEERTHMVRDKVKGSSIRDLRAILERMNYSIKELGIGQGLGSEVPADATLVLIFGPTKKFLDSEEGALRKYLERGGRLMAFLDPEAEVGLAGLLNPFGLKYMPMRLANDRFFVRVTHTKADRSMVFSTRFSAHPSVSTLSRNSSRVATVMLGAGHLEEIPPSIAGVKPQVQFTIHSMPFTWNDANGNQEFDAASEKRKVYELAAVVTRKVAQAAPKKGKKSENEEMRMIVVADSDMVSDRVFRNPGNGYLFVDGLKWLGGQEAYIGETSSEEDIRILHTRKEDQVWFYLTIFGIPALVLFSGLYYTLRRRKPPKARKDKRSKGGGDR
jgi:ABC-type uncharacterized transport system involved in gliding motility auxiliary subunit